MKTYLVSIQNHYISSISKEVVADSEVSAMSKARELFSFEGHDKSIKVTTK
jgi:hypothetical protein